MTERAQASLAFLVGMSLACLLQVHAAEGAAGTVSRSYITPVSSYSGPSAGEFRGVPLHEADRAAIERMLPQGKVIAGTELGGYNYADHIKIAAPFTYNGQVSRIKAAGWRSSLKSRRQVSS